MPNLSHEQAQLNVAFIDWLEIVDCLTAKKPVKIGSPFCVDLESCLSFSMDAQITATQMNALHVSFWLLTRTAFDPILATK